MINPECHCESRVSQRDEAISRDLATNSVSGTGKGIASSLSLLAMTGKVKGCHLKMKEHNYFVYIMTNKHNTVLYTGITNDLSRRVYEHKNKIVKGFTAKYNVNKLVYYEHTTDVEAAIAREKQIKAGSRAKKIALIERMNPHWGDLSETL